MRGELIAETRHKLMTTNMPAPVCLTTCSWCLGLS